MDVHSHETLADRIAENLLQRILNDKLLAGKALPSERDIMQELGVSRLACREALAKLRGMGIIRSRHGKGAYLAELDGSSMGPSVLRLLFAHGQIDNAHIIQVRLIIEPAAAALAAEHASIPQREEISRHTNEDAGRIDELPLLERAESFGKADVAFHQSIAVASGNPVLSILLKGIHELLLRVRLEVLLLKPEIARQALADHRRISKAILAGDPQSAGKAMERHIRLRGEALLSKS